MGKRKQEISASVLVDNPVVPDIPSIRGGYRESFILGPAYPLSGIPRASMPARYPAPPVSM